VQALLVEALVTEVRRLAVQLLDALYVPVDRRVWRRLLELEEVFGDGSATTVISLTQEDLAQVVGTTRPTMNRLLHDAETAGILRVSRGRVEIVDHDQLARRAR
jgi:CRP-like cAMP-binding protein